MNTIDEARTLLYKDIFDELYSLYTRKEFINPDPLQFLGDYDDPVDREIVGLIASSLALGRVRQIIKSVSIVLEKMPSPSSFLKKATPDSLRKNFEDFKHRFITGDELSCMLHGIKRVMDEYGSLLACFSAGLKDSDSTVLPALSNFVDELRSANGTGKNRLLPSPADGSACKRLNLFLRWMVRNDSVDPGGWVNVPANKLIVPLDTHMHKIGLTFGFTGRKQNDLKTAIEVTDAFRKFSPEDPVKYDFALTRLGIRNKTDMKSVFEKLLENGQLSCIDNFASRIMFNDDLHIMM